MRCLPCHCASQCLQDYDRRCALACLSGVLAHPKVTRLLHTCRLQIRTAAHRRSGAPAATCIFLSAALFTPASGRCHVHHIPPGSVELPGCQQHHPPIMCLETASHGTAKDSSSCGQLAVAQLLTPAEGAATASACADCCALATVTHSADNLNSSLQLPLICPSFLTRADRPLHRSTASCISLQLQAAHTPCKPACSHKNRPEGAQVLPALLGNSPKPTQTTPAA